MTNLIARPLDESIALWWNRIDPSSRRAFFIAVLVSVAAFGFEMTNLTLHHDDVLQIFVQHEKFQQYLGRFGFGWLYYYTQGAYFMPFVQMLQGIVLMAAYGVITGRLWGLRKTMELGLVAALMCVFPYLAQMYQYNSAMALYPLAHLAAAAAVALSLRGTARNRIAAVLLYVLAFSIYQSVLGCALAILAVWALIRLAQGAPDDATVARSILRPFAVALICIGVGGVLYVVSVQLLGLVLTSEHGVDTAFKLKPSFAPWAAVQSILDASRTSYLWPENYYPLLLKRTFLVVLAGAGLLSVWVPKGVPRKLAAAVLFLLLLLAPRTLQFLHPTGTYHNLTLTGYAVVVAGAAAIVYLTGPAWVRNAALIAAVGLLAGYVVQANRISTVGYLNTLAHVSQATQILARARSLPSQDWDGRTIVIAGSLRLYDDYPFKRATGIATDFLDAKHFQALARLLRDNARVLDVEEATPAVRTSAANLPAWPHPSSVSVVDGVALVVLGKPQEPTAPQTR